MQALKRDWGTTHLRATGGEGVALVFINSLGTDLRMWDDVVALLPAGWSNLRMDKRGHGLSSTAPQGYGIPELAEDVLAAMDHIGLARAVIVGCSIGGLIAQGLADGSVSDAQAGAFAMAASTSSHSRTTCGSPGTPAPAKPLSLVS